MVLRLGWCAILGAALLGMLGNAHADDLILKVKKIKYSKIQKSCSVKLAIDRGPQDTIEKITFRSKTTFAKRSPDAKSHPIRTFKRRARYRKDGYRSWGATCRPGPGVTCDMIQKMEVWNFDCGNLECPPIVIDAGGADFPITRVPDATD